MEKWKYKSLDWIHKAREKNYNKTNGLSPAELMEKSKKVQKRSLKWQMLSSLRKSPRLEYLKMLKDFAGMMWKDS